ncbi:hypothetical protein OAF64_02870 [Crocinitomicaceae bacterium]|nr:hypothetical protein [Crocinitomicaceae bacterium]
MKKLFIILFVGIAVNTAVLGQKQDSENITLEMEFSPLGSEPLAINGIRARYFKSEDLALRMGLFIGGSNNPTVTEVGDVELTSGSSSFDFTLRPGFEKHFDGTKFLSPYIGAEGLFGSSVSSSKSESIWLSDQDEVQTIRTSNSSPQFGLNILSGADIYIIDKFYLGIELGFGFLLDGAGKSRVKYQNPENDSMENTVTKGNSSQLNWGPNYQGTLRIGYCLK